MKIGTKILLVLCVLLTAIGAVLLFTPLWLGGIVMLIGGIYNATQVGSISAYERFEKKQKKRHDR